MDLVKNDLELLRLKVQLVAHPVGVAPIVRTEAMKQSLLSS